MRKGDSFTLTSVHWRLELLELPDSHSMLDATHFPSQKTSWKQVKCNDNIMLIKQLELVFCFLFAHSECASTCRRIWTCKYSVILSIKHDFIKLLQSIQQHEFVWCPFWWCFPDHLLSIPNCLVVGWFGYEEIHLLTHNFFNLLV